MWRDAPGWVWLQWNGQCGAMPLGFVLLSIKGLQRKILICGICGNHCFFLLCAGGFHCGPFAWAAKACKGPVNSPAVSGLLWLCCLVWLGKKREKFQGPRGAIPANREGSPSGVGRSTARQALTAVVGAGCNTKGPMPKALQNPQWGRPQNGNKFGVVNADGHAFAAGG